MTGQTSQSATVGGRFFAHRGLSGQAPENTFAAFEAARAAGFTWLETDVDICGDGTPILIHDSTLERTTDAKGSIYQTSRDDLAQIDAGTWFGPGFAGERIPTLAEFVNFLNTTGMRANIELKAHEAGGAGALALVDAVIGELSRLRESEQVLVSSFSQIQLYEFHRRAPQYETAVLFSANSLDVDWLSAAQLCGASYVHCEDAGMTGKRLEWARAAGLGEEIARGVSPQLIEIAGEYGYGVNVWTVNDAARARELFSWGAAGIFTDCLLPR